MRRPLLHYPFIVRYPAQKAAKAVHRPCGYRQHLKHLELTRRHFIHAARKLADLLDFLVDVGG